jgi:enterochelin esterase-like enzyme
MVITHRRQGRHPVGHRRFAAFIAAAVMGVGAVCVAQPATAAEPAPAPDPWVSTTPEGYYRFSVAQATIEQMLGAKPSVLELQGNIGPNGTWADVAMDPSGANYQATVGPMAPGLYYYQYTATMADRSKISFKEPTSPTAVTSQPSWNTFFVPGPSVQWMSDLPSGGEVDTLAYDSGVTGSERSALVWTPPGYDAERAEPYPVLYLLADDAQTYAEWSELGRAPQILDNLAAEGELEPMVVVMADANVADARSELLDSLVPAARADYNVSAEGAEQAVAGIGTGGYQALNTLLSDPGEFRSVGSLSGYLYSSISASAAAAINDGTDLLRVYVGNVLDPAYNRTESLLRKLEAAGVEHEFDGVNPEQGATWDTWRESLRDFASRLFRDVADHGPSEGNLALDAPYTAPAAGSITTPHIDENGIVTFETGTQWADAKDVAIWANWAPNGAWFRIQMEKVGDRWRAAMGPLDGFYYYRYVVDGVDKKDPADTVNTLTGVSPLYVPGETDQMLADVPAGKGGTLSVLDYDSAVAGEQRSAYVWTPPGYDAQREEPYPVLYLNHGGGQSWGDWVEVGRAVQILDNHYLNGDIVPMVVVMGNGNVSNYQKELRENLMPAVSAGYHVSDDPAQRAIAGLSMGGMNSLNTWLQYPGEFAYVGAFSGGLFSWPQVDAAAVNAGTKLARFYVGDISDFAAGWVRSTMAGLDSRGVEYEFAGESVGPHGFDVWSLNLIDFLPRLFRPDTETGIPVQAVVPEGENGVLALSVADFGDGVALSEAENAGDRLRFVGELPTVTVTDSRTTAQAGASGWAVSGQAYTFTSDVRSLGAEHLGWTPRVGTPRDGLEAGAAVGTAMGDGEGLATPAQLASADVVGRYGSATLGAGLALEVPIDTQPGTYTGTLTLSLFPVD